MNYLFQKQLSPLESLGAESAGAAKDSDNGEYPSDYSLTLKELSYNNRNPKGEALTVSEFENNFAFIADQAKKNKAAIGELSTTANNLGSATNAVKMIGKLTGADLNMDTTGFNYINVDTNEVSGYGDTVNFITGETLSIYFPISDVTAQVRLVEVRNGITDSKQSSATQAAAQQPAFTTSVKALVWENLENQLVAFPAEDMTNVTITGVDSGIVVPLVNMGYYEPNPIQTITFDESGTYVITDILMTNASASISNAKDVLFLSFDPFSDSYAKGDDEGSLAKSSTSKGTSIEDSFIARTNDEDGSSLQMLRSSNSFINTMVGPNNGNVFTSLGQTQHTQLGVSTSTRGGIMLVGNSLVSDEMYLSVMTTEGSDVTCDVYVFGYRIGDVSNSQDSGLIGKHESEMTNVLLP